MKKNMGFKLDQIKHNVNSKNITDYSVFDISRPLTDDILTERKEMREIAESLVQFFEKGKRQHMFIYGNAGIGKTAIMNYLTDLFAKEYDFNHYYIDCRVNNTSTKIMKYISDTFKNVSADRLIPEVKQILEKKKNIMLFDDFQLLKDEQLIGYLSRDRTLQSIMIFITNDPQSYSCLKEDVKSSLSTWITSFDRYSTDEIYKILKLRADKGLEHYDTDILYELSRLIFTLYDSDIRVGIKSLEVIFQSPNKKDWEIDIEKIARDQEAKIMISTLRSLNKTQRKFLTTLLQLLRQQETLSENSPVKGWSSKEISSKHILEKSTINKVYFYQVLQELQKMNLISSYTKRIGRSYHRFVGFPDSGLASKILQFISDTDK